MLTSKINNFNLHTKQLNLLAQFCVNVVLVSLFFLVVDICSLVSCEMQLPLHVSPIFEKDFGTQLMLGGSTRQQMLLYIEEKAKKILVVDEYNAVIRHIKQVNWYIFHSLCRNLERNVP